MNFVVCEIMRCKLAQNDFWRRGNNATYNILQPFYQKKKKKYWKFEIAYFFLI